MAEKACVPKADQGWGWRLVRRPIERWQDIRVHATSGDEAGPNPHLAEALKVARRFEAGKRREMARFIFDNVCYFDFWQKRGSHELLQLSMLVLGGRTVSRRRHAEPEAVYMVRLWAADRLASMRGEAPVPRHEANDRLLRRFVHSVLPRAEIDEIHAHDWSI